MMIHVEIDLSSTGMPARRIMEVTNWVSATLNEELAESITVHAIRVEEIDA